MVVLGDGWIVNVRGRGSRVEIMKVRQRERERDVDIDCSAPDVGSHPVHTGYARKSIDGGRVTVTSGGITSLAKSSVCSPHLVPD